MSLLEIRNLHVNVGEREILKGIDLTVDAGEVHSIMGPNGSGKSTLAQVLARRESYNVTEGQILYEGKDLLEMKPEDAACEGIFMAFQYPVEIPGITNAYFLRSALNAIRRYRGLDEMDSGLDIDALRVVARGVNKMRDPDRAMIVVTHYQRLLNHIVPDRVHVLVEGRIACSGGPDLALQLEEKGYGSMEAVARSATPA